METLSGFESGNKTQGQKITVFQGQLMAKTLCTYNSTTNVCFVCLFLIAWQSI